MNSRSILALALASASAALAVETTPVGYTTQTLQTGIQNITGFNLVNPKLVAGTVSDMQGSSVFDSNINFSITLPAGKMCTFEVISGIAIGTVQEFNSWSTNSITLPVAIPNLAVGDKYVIRVVSTLQELFPVGFLTGSATATNADKVWVPDGAGGYTKYWYRVTLQPTGWRTTTTGTNDTGSVSGDVPIPYIDALVIERKGTSKEFVLTGEVKPTETNVLVATGLNPVSVVPPVGLTLFTSGLQSQITSAATATNADKIWVPNGSGGYTKYYNRITIQPTGWRITTTGTNDVGGVSADVPLTPGIVIERRGAPKVIKMNVPSSYVNIK